MVDPKRKLLWFPQTMNTDQLNGEQMFFSSIDSGIVKVEALGLERNHLFGGNVMLMGKISRFGIYACPHYLARDGELCGLYVFKWDDLTPEGQTAFRAWCEKEWPGYTVLERGTNADVPLTEKEVAERKAEGERRLELEKAAIDAGAPKSETKRLGAAELENLIAAKASGKVEGYTVVTEPVTSQPPKQTPGRVKTMKRNISTT